MSRTWAERDRVAEYRTGRWRLGVVTSADKWTVAIRWDGAEFVSFRSPAAASLADPDAVPIDERHWLTEQERDQLVRQEAAERLREMWRALPGDCADDDLLDIAHRLATCDAHGDPDPRWAAAARALLATARQPATAP